MALVFTVMNTVDYRTKNEGQVYSVGEINILTYGTRLVQIVKYGLGIRSDLEVSVNKCIVTRPLLTVVGGMTSEVRLLY